MNISSIAYIIDGNRRWATQTCNLHNFQGLDSEITNKLIEAGDSYTVARNLEKFNLSESEKEEIQGKMIFKKY